MDFLGLMKKAEKVQADMQRAKDELATLEVSGEAGGGLVNVTLNGQGDCTGLAIDDSLLNLEEKDVLEDLIRAALNNARTNVNEVSRERMAEVTKGLPLPPGFSL